ncbi:transposase domain-containing protein [Actinocorallia lasiicapitis]
MGAYPPEVVDRAIETCGAVERRERMLSARVIVYFSLVMVLYPEMAYAEVWRLTVAGLELAQVQPLPPAGTEPSTAAISRARARLGWEPLAEVFAQRTSIDAPGSRNSGAAGRTFAIDVESFEASSTEQNRRAFGHDRNVDLLTLTSATSGELCAARILPTPDFAPPPVGLASLHRHDLLISGSPLDAEALGLMTDHGAELIFPWEEESDPPPGMMLADSSVLVEMRRRAGRPPLAVRVLDRRSPRLATTFTDPSAWPADEVRARYQARYRAPALFPRVGAMRPTLRSKTPDSVLQEIWASLCVRAAVGRSAR